MKHVGYYDGCDCSKLRLTCSNESSENGCLETRDYKGLPFIVFVYVSPSVDGVFCDYRLKEQSFCYQSRSVINKYCFHNILPPPLKWGYHFWPSLWPSSRVPWRVLKRWRLSLITSSRVAKSALQWQIIQSWWAIFNDIFNSREKAESNDISPVIW